MSQYKLRPGTRDDAGVVREIFFAALSEHGFAPIEANVNPEIATFGDRTRDELVATDGDDVVGFIILAPAIDDGVGELSKVFVSRAHQGRGVGTQLIASVMKLAKLRGYRSLILYTNEAFATATAYYERHGWSRVSSEDGEVVYTLLLVEPTFWLRHVFSLLDHFARTRSRLQDELDEAASAGIERGGVRTGPPSRRPRAD